MTGKIKMVYFFICVFCFVIPLTAIMIIRGTFEAFDNRMKNMKQKLTKKLVWQKTPSAE